MVVLLILSLIPFLMSFFGYVNSTYIFIVLFALDFLIVGIVSTKAVHPLLSFKELLRKIALIIPFGLMFTIISTGIVYFLNMTASSILLILSVFSAIINILAIIRTRNKIKDLTPNQHNERQITQIILILAIFCVVSYIGMEVPPFSVIPLWFGLCIPFIFLLPGYLFVNILNPFKDAFRLLETLGISIFISLVITSIVGLIVAQIEHLLNMRHVSMVLTVITLIVLLPLYYIRIKEKQPYELFNDYRINRLFILITIIAIIGVIASGILVSTNSLDNLPSNTESLFQGNTSFEVLGVHETPDEEGYYNFTSGENINLTIDITNNEHKDMNYRLKIDIENETNNRTFLEENIAVKDSENMQYDTNITMTTGKKDIKFTLYDDSNKPYKIRHFYVNVQN